MPAKDPKTIYEPSVSRELSTKAGIEHHGRDRQGGAANDGAKSTDEDNDQVGYRLILKEPQISCIDSGSIKLVVDDGSFMLQQMGIASV